MENLLKKDKLFARVVLWALTEIKGPISFNLLNKLCYVIRNKDDITPAGEEFKQEFAHTTSYFRGTVLSQGSKDQLLPLRGKRQGDCLRPVIMVPSSDEQVAIYCPWLAWCCARPMYAHKDRARLWEQPFIHDVSPVYSSSTSTGCPISDIAIELPSDSSDSGEW